MKISIPSSRNLEKHSGIIESFPVLLYFSKRDLAQSNAPHWQKWVIFILLSFRITIAFLLLLFNESSSDSNFLTIFDDDSLAQIVNLLWVIVGEPISSYVTGPSDLVIFDALSTFAKSLWEKTRERERERENALKINRNNKLIKR